MSKTIMEIVGDIVTWLNQEIFDVKWFILFYNEIMKDISHIFFFKISHDMSENSLVNID